MNHPHTPAGHFSLSTTCSHCDRLVHRAAHVVHFFMCFVVMLGAYQLGFNAPRKPAQPVVYAGPATIRNAGMTAVSAAIMENLVTVDGCAISNGTVGIYEDTVLTQLRTSP